MVDIKDPEFDLMHYLDVVLRRRWIIASALIVVVLCTAVYTFSMKPVFQASTLLVIEKERGGGAVYSNGTMVESSNDDYYQTQYRLLQSVSLCEKVYEDLQLQDHPDFRQPRGLEKLQGAIQISPVLRSRLVYVKASSHDAAMAAKIADHVSDLFVKQNLANQMFISKEVLQALQMKEGREQTYDSLPAVVNSPLIQTLKGEYAKLESQHAEMSQKFTAKYPAMMSLRSNMAALKGQIQGETLKIVQSLKTELSGQLKGNNVRVVDAARVPDKPIRPKKTTNLVLGVIAGLAVGFGLAFLIETLDQSIRTQEDVESKLRQPFLGVIPRYAGKGESVYHALMVSELSLTSEAFRNLRTMVDFACVTDKPKALLVTSTVQSEGKTYVASNLAVAFAQTGERVLLIDGDLRRPQVHKNFSLSAKRGLSDFLVSGVSVDDLEKMIHPSDVPNLKVLTCGPRPPNPSELLNTPRAGALLSWAESHFDRIIVDCTPLFPVNDTLLWGRHIPWAIFVVRHGATRAPLVANAAQKLQGGGIKILGVAVNSAEQGGLSYSPTGYYYQQYYHSYEQETPGVA